MNLLSNAGTTGAYFNERMSAALADHPHVGEVRGEGMLCAIELVESRDKLRFYDPASKTGPSVVAAMLKRGVIARAMPQGDIIGFAPPLCLSKTEADLIVAATCDAIDEVLLRPA